jgi:hypothetical protein
VRRCALGLYALLALTGAGVGFSAAATPIDRDAGRTAIQRSLDLLGQSARKWPAGCASCHHHVLQIVTADAARSRGFTVDETFLRSQHAAIERELARSRDAMVDAALSATVPAPRVGPNPDMIFGYALFGLAQTGAPASDATGAALRYLLRRQHADGHWESHEKRRPPFEASDFTATALASRVIPVYAAHDRRGDRGRALNAAATWLSAATPADTEDRAFRLLGLHWSGARREQIDQAGRDLLRSQQSDGGWTQNSGASDAYATGESLVALRTARVIHATSAEFRKGTAFLRTTQHADGAWYVRSRATPVQKYFDTGFPYGTDQFISYTATCFATLALLGDDASAGGALRD